ncbi:MAG: hypothetical protein ABW163_05700 [Luteimonas sp.]
MRATSKIATLPLLHAGLGLLMWSGMTAALLQLKPDGASTLHRLQLLGLMTGVGLTLAGAIARRLAGTTLPSSRRSAVLLGAALAAAALLVTLLATGLRTSAGPALVALGVALLFAGFGAVASIATDFAGADAPPAWRHPLVLPVQLLLAMGTGLALLYLLMDRLFVSGSDARTMLATLTGLGACLALCKWLYWRALDATAWRDVRVLVPVLLAGGPLLAWMLALAASVPAPASLGLSAVAMLAAAVLDARHFIAAGIATDRRDSGHAS